MDQSSLRTSHSRSLTPGNKGQGAAFAALEAAFRKRVATPLSLACGGLITLVRIDELAPESLSDYGAAFIGDPCSGDTCNGHCHQSWTQQLHNLRTDHRTHLHQCKFGRWCAIVPVVVRGKAVAAAKLICSQMVSEGRFAAFVGILETMVRDLVQGGTVNDFEEHAAPLLTQLKPRPQLPSQQELHPLIPRAISYIEQNLGDPELSVGHVAKFLNTNTSYLSHVFATGMGQRMQGFISGRRMARAKHLLISTNWQIKRVAHECGHVNANWFSQVFRAATGSKPRAYRTQSRQSPIMASG